MNKSIDPKAKWLIDYYQKARERNNNYSLRAFAKNIDLSPSYISQIFNGVKNLHDKTFDTILNKFGVENKEREEIYLEVKKHNKKRHIHNALQVLEEYSNSEEVIKLISQLQIAIEKESAT